MSESLNKSVHARALRPVAVVDVGTTSIRMAIAEIGEQGYVRLLESLSQGVSLGNDTFSTGEISRRTIEDCVAVLWAYRQKLAEYKIDVAHDVRVVATSAVREAANRLAFVDRAFVGTGFDVEPIEEAEVHRITYRSIQPLLKAQPDLFRSPSLIVEVGGGSTEILVLERDNVVFSHSYRLGSLRMQQSLQSLRVSKAKIRDIMETEIRSQMEVISEQLPRDRPMNMVAMGGDVRFALRELLPEAVNDELSRIPVSMLAEFVEKLSAMRLEGIVQEYRLTFPEAQTLVPALLISLRLAEMLGQDHIIVSQANLRDGLLLDMAEEGRWTEDFRKQIVRAAWELARKYHVDEDHARAVADLSKLLFRSLQGEHQLDDRYETVLYVAALLHEIGGFVNTSSIHKHSMYLVVHSDLFGLTPDDLLLVALITRYHRRALPKPTHQPYNTLDRDRRIIVSKLAAILRLAIALDASRSQRISRLECNRVRNRLVISVPHVDDLSVEQLALQSGRVFFESIFGLRVLLRPQHRPSITQPSTQL